MRIFHEILSISRSFVMNMNNVMMIDTLQLTIDDHQMISWTLTPSLPTCLNETIA